MFASLTTQLKNDGGAITFSLLRVKLAALCGAKYTKAGYQNRTTFPSITGLADVTGLPPSLL